MAALRGLQRVDAVEHPLLEVCGWLYQRHGERERGNDTAHLTLELGALRARVQMRLELRRLVLIEGVECIGRSHRCHILMLPVLIRHK